VTRETKRGGNRLDCLRLDKKREEREALGEEESDEQGKEIQAGKFMSSRVGSRRGGRSSSSHRGGQR